MAYKKLYDGPIISVDDQIVRWRKKLKAAGTLLGKASRQAEKKNNMQSRKAEDEELIRTGRKKFF